MEKDIWKPLRKDGVKLEDGREYALDVERSSTVLELVDMGRERDMSLLVGVLNVLWQV